MSTTRAEPRRPQPSWADLFIGTAYILPIDSEGDGEVYYGIFAPDGTPLGVAPTRELAMAVTRQHSIRPLDAH